AAPPAAAADQPLEISRQLRAAERPHRGHHVGGGHLQRARGGGAGRQVHRAGDRFRVGCHRFRRLPVCAAGAARGGRRVRDVSMLEVKKTMRRLLPLLLTPLLLALSACSFAEYRRAQLAEQKGDWDQAVIFYLGLVEKQPDDLTYRSALMRAKIKASQAHFETAKKFAEAGSLERAQFEYRQAVELDSTNQYAATELEKVRQAI